MVHNLTHMSAGPYQEEERNQMIGRQKAHSREQMAKEEKEWENKRAYEQINTALNGHLTDKRFLQGMQIMQSDMSTDELLKRLSRCQKRAELWFKVISYFKRQALYTYALENGRGGIAQAGRLLGVTRQRAHDMYKEAENERLTQFTPLFFVENFEKEFEKIGHNEEKLFEGELQVNRDESSFYA